MKTKTQVLIYRLLAIILGLLAGFIVGALTSCSAINGMEQSHYSLYQSKALFCTSFYKGKAVFTNPQGTHKYICTDRKLSYHWSIGDTLILDSHIPRSQVYKDLEYETFWSLKTLKP